MNSKIVLVTIGGIIAVVALGYITQANSDSTSGSASSTTGVQTSVGSGNTGNNGQFTGNNGSFTTGNNGESTRSNGQFTTDSNSGSTTQSSPADSRNMPVIGRAPGMTDSTSSTNTDLSPSIGGRASGITETTNSNTNFRTAGERGLLGVQSTTIGERLPTNSSLISRGEVIGVNKSGKTISVRESVNGPITTYSINDDSMLEEIYLGETVQVFSQPN